MRCGDNSFRRVLRRPTDIDGRGQMLLGAHLAGAAIENSMLGAAHACANPLTAHYQITHGVAVGIMLPHIIRYNAAAVGRMYGDLAVDCGLCAANDARAGELLADFVRELIAESGQATSLAAWNIHPDSLSQLAEEASSQWTGNFNPRPVDQQSLKEIYECAM